jgi:hypothetical protein
MLKVFPGILYLLRNWFIIMHNVTACWGDPDEVYYMTDDNEVHSLNIYDNGVVFGIWDGVFVNGSDNYDTSNMIHDDFIMYYLYYQGWPAKDIVPIRDIDEDGWDYEKAKDIQVQYDNWGYYDDDDNVLPEYQMTYGELIDMLGSPKARGRLMHDYNTHDDFIAFWDEPTLQEKKLVYKHMGNAYIVMTANEDEAKDYYINQGHEIPTLKDWILGNADMPRFKANKEGYALHLMNGKDKWGNTQDFRNVRDERNAKKLGNVTMAQYHNLIYQEGMNRIDKIIKEQINKVISGKL